MKTKTIVICAIFAALMCVFSVITVPTGIIPITLGTLGIMLTAVILGSKKGAVSVAVFILLGIVGLPVFSGFKGGIQVIFGPTGGYIWSYIPMAVIIGLFSAKLPEQKAVAMLKMFAGCIVGMIICYALGTVQFMIVQKMGLIKSLSACVIPFIPFDIAKAVLASYLGFTIRAALQKARLLD